MKKLLQHNKVGQARRLALRNLEIPLDLPYNAVQQNNPVIALPNILLPWTGEVRPAPDLIRGESVACSNWLPPLCKRAHRLHFRPGT
jgi:hypothetical protein